MKSKKTSLKFLFSFMILFLIELNNLNAQYVGQYDQTAEEGQSVELSCALTDKYTSEVSWKKVDGEKSSSSEEINGKLQITELSGSDSGEYECSHGGDYFFGEDTETDTVKLTVVRRQPNDVSINKDDDIEPVYTQERTEPIEETTQERTEPIEETTQERTEPIEEITQVRTEPIEETTQERTEPIDETTQERTQPIVETTPYIESTINPSPETDPFVPDYTTDYTTEFQTEPNEFTTTDFYQPDILTTKSDLDLEDGFFRIITSVDKQSINVYEGERIDVICNSKTNAYTIDILWLNPSREPINSDNKFEISSTRTLRNRPLTKESTFTLNDARVEDSGIYECRGTTGLLDDESKFNIRIVKKEIYTIRTTVERPEIELTVDSSGEITCTSFTNDNNLDITWINPSRMQILPSNRYQIITRVVRTDPLTKESTLRFMRASEDDNGQYECRGTIRTTEDTAQFSVKIINRVTNTVQTSVDRPELIFDIDDQGEISCTSFTNDNFIDILWIDPRREQILPSNRYQITTRTISDNPLTKKSTLRFLRVSSDDYGQYECRGTIRSAEDSTTFFLKINPKVVSNQCNCNNHSDCTCSGYCIKCEHNTFGKNCELCDFENGYYGDATKGTPYDCMNKQTTRTTTTTTTTRTTSVDYIRADHYIPEDDDCKCNGHSFSCTCSGICLYCLHNTEGEKCERCKQGYHERKLRENYFECVPDVSNYNQPIKSKVKSCNEYGTAHQSGNTCKCKTGVTGKYCDECKPRYFNLIENNKKGCSSCFCNGLSVDCKSSDLYYRKKLSDYENEDWYLSNKFTQMKENVEFIENGIEFNKINNHANEDLYFIVSSKFKGNHLLSYNGELSFEFKFDLPESSLINNIQQLEIRISGSNINVIHVFSQDLLPNVENQISVKLNENNFQRYGDKNKIEREFLLMALSNIDLIMIKAKLANGQTSARINNFSVEYAGKMYGFNQKLASAIEVCKCPTGYAGSSCELCASGYQRSLNGFYWGYCEPINY